MTKRLLALLLAVVMVVSMLPLGAFAEDELTAEESAEAALDGALSQDPDNPPPPEPNDDGEGDGETYTVTFGCTQDGMSLAVYQGDTLMEPDEEDPFRYTLSAGEYKWTATLDGVTASDVFTVESADLSVPVSVKQPNETKDTEEQPEPSDDLDALLARYKELLEAGDEDAIGEFTESLTEEQLLALREKTKTPDQEADVHGDDDSIVFVPLSPFNEYDVQVNGEGPVLTIYCLQQKERWPYGDENVHYVRYDHASSDEFANTGLLSHEEIQILRRLVYAGYPNDSQGYLRKLREAIGDDYYSDEYAGLITNSAIWVLMTEWGKAGSDPGQVLDYNNPTNDPSEKAIIDMVTFAKGSTPVGKPASPKIAIAGDGHLTRDGNGQWSTGDLKITEPANYNLLFTLNLPDGASAVDADGNEITSVAENQVFRIVSSDPNAINQTTLSASAVAKYPTEVSFFVTKDPTGRKDQTGRVQNYQTMLYIEEASLDLEGSLELTAEPGTGGLSVTKHVAGNNASTDKAFSFTVTLGNTTVNGTKGDMTFENGVATFDLKHGETKTATGLPAGVTYTVEEDNYSGDGYETSSSNASGAIQTGATAEAVFTNTRNTYGDLSVTKKVEGNAPIADKEFSFTVTLGDTTVNGTKGDMTFVNGKATFDLKHGETKTATGLPHGTAYTVAEADYSNDGYETAATGETGKIQTGTPAAAVFTNTRNLYGDLAITKHVHGNSADKALEFNFTVTLEDTSISGTYGDLTFKDGVAEFTLKDGETKEAPGLPYNIKYTVTEQDYSEEGYVTTKTGDSGTVHPDMPAAVFTNTRDTFGSLSVTKHVAGNNADTDKAFHFTVLLSDPTINNTHGDMTFVNGKAEFDLKDGETKTADGLPNGIEYTVAEADYANAGYVTEKTGNSGIIDSENPAAAVFTNTRDTFGELSVTKHVAGNAASIDKEFSFTVTLTDTTVNGTKGEMTFENGVATFDLKDGETKTATGLPHGTTYTVTEESYANDGYTTEKTGDSGKIQTGTPAKAEFTNTRNTYGDLSVTKKVAGNAADKEKEFSFTVTLGDTNINGKKGDMTFENGVATFTLKDGETKKATGLPNGVSYTVAENDYRKDGYSTAGTNASGNIAENTEIASVFTNTRNANGSLSITKTLAGNGTDADRAFKFTITMDDDSIDGAYSGVTFTKGVAEIQLKGGETKVIEGLPNGAGYTVAEEDCSADGYTTTKTGETGKISEKAAAIVSFTNKREVGKLTVSKSIKGNAADLDQEFKFTVILYYKDKPVSGTFSDVEFNENGIGSFYLTNRESKTIEGLLHGTTFTVVEDRGDYTNNLPEGGAKGTIDKDTPATVSCVNTLDTYGDLVVTKTVAGNSGNTNKAFSFMVTLDDRSINGTYGDMTFTNGIAAFTLKDGQSKTAKDLPNGVSYTVTEEDYSGSGYVTTKGGETGTIVGGKTCEADFTNTKDLFGKLTVTKTVAGNAASKTKAFTFTVELSDTSINGTYGDMTFKKGVATFTLKHNESKTAKKLPAGIEYTVTESRYSGYKVTKTGSTGTIKGNATRTAAFTNTRNNFGYGVIPKTGDTNSILPWILLILAAAAVMVITVFTGKRRRHSGKYSR